MMTPEKILYETEVTATRGRDGKAAGLTLAIEKAANAEFDAHTV